MLSVISESLASFTPHISSRTETGSKGFSFEKKRINQYIQLLLKQELRKPARGGRLRKLSSKNSIWDVSKLIDRYMEEEYLSDQSRIDLLRADAKHHALEMALVESITRFTYYYSPESDELLGDGYSEDLLLLLNNFSQDLANQGVDSSRASVEHWAFSQVKEGLYDVAKDKHHDGLSSKAILITSFPDEKSSGYHEVDSKYSWDKKETHHSFFYLARVGKVDRDEDGKVTGFEITTTQYRLWPNVRQALALHDLLGQPIKNPGSQVPNQLFANLIPINIDMLNAIIPENDMGPIDPKADELEDNLRKILFLDSEKHAIDHTKIPDIDIEKFWIIQKKYFEEFYLKVAIPKFREITNLQAKKHELKPRELHKQLQEKVDYLDKAFFYYSQILLGWIKENNLNPEYEDAFKENSKIKRFKAFQQKLLLKILGHKQNDQIPSPNELIDVLDIDHKLATTGKISAVEKQRLINVWGFFSSISSLSSLLQCGALTPFTLPISIMNSGFDASSLTSFSASLSEIPLPQKKELLTAMTTEEYVELDLTHLGADKIYTVPNSYLDGKSCVVGDNGQVLGPCIDPETKKRIPLDDPRDTLAYPMTLIEFNKYIATLKADINKQSLDTLEEIFNEDTFSDKEQKIASKAISLLRKKLIKESLNLNDLFVGDVVKKLSDQNEWLQDLILKLSFSMNPVSVLIFEVTKKIAIEPEFFDTLEVVGGNKK